MAKICKKQPLDIVVCGITLRISKKYGIRVIGLALVFIKSIIQLAGTDFYRFIPILMAPNF